MDTKWKSKFTVLIWVVLISFGISGILTIFLNNHEYMKTSYFKTSDYENLEKELINYVNAFEISYQTKQELLESLTVSDEEIHEHRYRYGDLAEQIETINEQYQTQTTNAIEQNNQSVIDYYTKERDKKIADITKNFESDEYIEQKILKEKQKRVDEYYRELEQNREDYQLYKEAFLYYLKDTKTEKVYTNLPSKKEAEIKKYINENETIYSRAYEKSESMQLIYDYEDILPESKFEPVRLKGEVAFAKEIPAANPIAASYKDYKNQQKLFLLYTLIVILSLITSFIIGRKKNMIQKIVSEKWLTLYRRIPIDAAIALLFTSACISIYIIVDINFIYYDFLIDRILFHFLIMILFVGFTIVQGMFLKVRLQGTWTEKTVWKDTFIYKILNLFRTAFLNRRVGTQVFLLLAIVFLFGAGTLLVLIAPVFLIIYIPLFFLVGLPLFFMIIKRIGYFNKIILNTNALANGEFEPDLEIKGKSVFARLAHDINIMKHGVKTSQKAQAKSERLKTELITNVSHDLRTPLTSIITYSELLKNPLLTDDERVSYLDIIDRKSKRLKVLIDDLFEASKMASGNIQLMTAKVDLVQLLQQALAEYNETIQQSELTFRITKPSTPIYAWVDGQKVWRVFDNLIGNILKYSLENTRAYINIKEVDDKVMITFKNVSRYELSEDTDELIERFKRGDQSRHTDGSGLGLAIAKSIIDLHEGTFDLEVDGDLFKVIIMLNQLKE
ncbi:sensor histidine kinase [Metabacillus malikii]|uniref:histidine kinase n=1 Tax=Metabacillus malikii TaxID=1504265 RepID=A0ABT9ZBG3_9BACI|nr:HAMP domain-containing sensor histidine kinase [Metabacillus malikii]MDQ0229249.1 signal transduction histidine kinase [Metabacillus malikii]